jgi:hypothetical protein
MSILPPTPRDDNPEVTPDGFLGPVTVPPPWRRATVLASHFDWATRADATLSVRGFRSGNLALVPSRTVAGGFLLGHYRTGQALVGSGTLRRGKRLAAALRARFGDLTILDRRAEGATLTAADQVRLIRIGRFLATWTPPTAPPRVRPPAPYVPFDDHTS